MQAKIFIASYKQRQFVNQPKFKQVFFLSVEVEGLSD